MARSTEILHSFLETAQQQAVVKRAYKLPDGLYLPRSPAENSTHFNLTEICISLKTKEIKDYVSYALKRIGENNYYIEYFIHELTKRIISLEHFKRYNLFNFKLTITEVTHRLMDNTYEIHYRYTEEKENVIVASMPLKLVISHS